MNEKSIHPESQAGVLPLSTYSDNALENLHGRAWNLGLEDGAAANDRPLSRELAAEVIAAAADLDVEALPWSTLDLSGEWADGPTPDGVLADIYHRLDIDPARLGEGSEVFLDAYQSGYDEAAQTMAVAHAVAALVGVPYLSVEDVVQRVFFENAARRYDSQAYTVVCEDGNIRHGAPFHTRAEAAAWAEWGHACTNNHRVEAVGA